jgi:ribosomal protein RSM22 (predicted rRNA methylase)
MQLPAALRQAVEQELAACSEAALRAASTRLTQLYREDGATSAQALSSDEQRAAYLAVRMPATYAATVAALRWAREGLTFESSTDEIRTVLDLGSGPGTALWAASEVFPEIDSLTGFERNPRLITVAQRLVLRAERSALRTAQWIAGDLTASLPQGGWDLVICSYALNELREAQRAELIRKAWARTAKLLIFIEPGTKAGFANILAARGQLLSEGASIAAPCPNALACPMMTGDDWCHFAARVERTAEHRRLKDASLGHEDEKFSYVAFSRSSAQTSRARIVRHPRIFSGYTQLTLCSAGEVANTTVTRSKKEDWRKLKRLGWGDAW